jgi:hypothetical protein
MMLGPVDLSQIHDTDRLKAMAYDQVAVIARGEQAKQILQVIEARIQQLATEQAQSTLAALEAAKAQPPAPRSERRAAAKAANTPRKAAGTAREKAVKR